MCAAGVPEAPFLRFVGWTAVDWRVARGFWTPRKLSTDNEKDQIR